MNIHALCHIPYSNYAYAYDLKTIHIRLRTAKNDMNRVDVCFGGKFNWQGKSKGQMNRIFSDEYFDYYQYELCCEDTRIGYYFELTDNEGNFKIYSEVGMLDEFDDDMGYCLYFQYPYINASDVHVVPNWLNDAVFYQIFVERFCKGNFDDDRDFLEPWDSEPSPTSFFGGDLQGIIDKMDYLDELGINAIYLTPIFQSVSNHKYDISDYMKIDEYFGSKETLCELVNEAHKRDIKVMLDAVFNHCSKNIEFFQDVIENGENSKYKDWFFINEFPVSVEDKNYETFSFCNYMPKLNTENKSVQDYLFSVVDYWSSETGIDGWRLDVADEVNRDFWRQFRKHVKKIDKNMVIIGESWHIALDWLRGDMYDSVMNYPVTKLMLDYFAKKTINADIFSCSLSRHLMQYSEQVNEAMLNLLDSHDTERFLTTCKGDKDRLLAATTFLYGYIGMPCTYYGTEIGMDGAYDPGCRKGFDWNKDNWDLRVYDYYKKIISIRRKEDALKRGNVRFYSKNDIFIMARKYKDEIIIVLANTSDSAKFINLKEVYCSDICKECDKATFTELISINCELDIGTELIKIMPDGAGYYKKNI